MSNPNEALRSLLVRLRRNRNRPDLHSAVCNFASGESAFIEANWDKSFTVFPTVTTTILRPSRIECENIEAVLELYPEMLLDYET